MACVVASGEATWSADLRSPSGQGPTAIDFKVVLDHEHWIERARVQPGRRPHRRRSSRSMTLPSFGKAENVIGRFPADVVSKQPDRDFLFGIRPRSFWRDRP